MRHYVLQDSVEKNTLRITTKKKEKKLHFEEKLTAVSEIFTTAASTSLPKLFSFFFFFNFVIGQETGVILGPHITQYFSVRLDFIAFMSFTCNVPCRV